MMQLGAALQLDQYAETNNSVTRTCSTPGCGDTTREGKPYCTEHVESHPYVQFLLKRVADRDIEDEAVRMQGSSAVNIDGITVEEITLQLRTNGTRTVERLCREIALDKSVIRSYIVAMKAAGLVTVSWTDRHSMAATLVSHNPEDLIEE